MPSAVQPFAFSYAARVENCHTCAMEPFCKRHENEWGKRGCDKWLDPDPEETAAQLQKYNAEFYAENVRILASVAPHEQFLS